MTVPNQNYNNDQDTSYDTMLTSLKSIMGTGGNGTSSSDRQKVLFFVGDGVGDSAKQPAPGHDQRHACQDRSMSATARH